MLRKNFPNAVEINADPVNLSRCGICVALQLDAAWETLSPDHKIELFLERGIDRQSLKGRVVRAESDHRLLGIEFLSPLRDISQFLVPQELQS